MFNILSNPSGFEDIESTFLATRMAAKFLTDVHRLGPFVCADSSGIAARWERWLRAFELFANGKGITNNGQKKASYFTQPDGRARYFLYITGGNRVRIPSLKQ